MGKGIAYFNRAALAAAAGILAVQLLLPPVVGLANTGDFGKITGVFGFGAPEDDDYKFISVRYTFEPKYKFLMGYFSSEHLLAAGALGLNAVFHRSGGFDLRWIGLIHAALILCALALCPTRPVLVTLLLLLIFGDISYVGELNSFYMDAAAYVFLL